MKKFHRWLLLFGLLLVVSIWMQIWSGGWSDQHLRIIFCDVGQGDATLITLGRTQMLVDGGPGKQVLDCLDRYLPLGDKQIEIIAASHSDKDHIGGLIEVLRNYQVQKAIFMPINKDTEVYKKLYAEISGLSQQGKLDWLALYAGDQLTLGSLTARLVWPSSSWVASLVDQLPDLAETPGDHAVLGVSTQHTDVNDFSLVWHLKYSTFDLLLNGDADQDVQDDQLGTDFVPLDIEVMSVPHHGSREGILNEWLSTVSPQLAVISVGAKNRYGHPAPEILQRLQRAGVKILRTDEVGDIVIESDGAKWWIDSAR